jgi:hypothetical protein
MAGKVLGHDGGHPRISSLLILVVVAAVLVPGAPVQAFTPEIHESITRAALVGGDTIASDALDLIVKANRRSDWNQWEEARHYDNARDPAEICQRWASGVNRWYEDAIKEIAPADREKRRLKNRDEALELLGKILHAVQDFYSHSNYVELSLPAPQPGFLLAACNPPDLPRDLQTGYFSVRHGLDGCPSDGPPAGFRYCHSTLNKDKPGTPNYAVARSFATTATKLAWDELRRRVIAAYGRDQSTGPECLFMKLAWGGDHSCQRR